MTGFSERPVVSRKGLSRATRGMQNQTIGARVRAPATQLPHRSYSAICGAAVEAVHSAAVYRWVFTPVPS